MDFFAVVLEREFDLVFANSTRCHKGKDTQLSEACFSNGFLWCLGLGANDLSLFI